MPAAHTGASTVIRPDASTVPRPSPVPSPVPSPAPADDRLRPGGRGYRRANVALFAAGLATFALLYSTQALLPALSAGLALSPSQASLTVSVSTAALALALLPVSALSERYGRTRVMTASVFAASALALAIPFAPD